MTEQEAIKRIKDFGWHHAIGDHPHSLRTVEAFKMAINALEQQEKSRWIPVTKRLPEEDTDVLITYRYKEGEGDTAHSYIDITSYGQMCFGGRAVEGVKHWRPPFECFASNYKVVAWRPLPEPYKEETE